MSLEKCLLRVVGGRHVAVGKGKSIHLLRGLGWCPLMQLPRGADVRSGGRKRRVPTC